LGFARWFWHHLSPILVFNTLDRREKTLAEQVLGEGSTHRAVAAQENWVNPLPLSHLASKNSTPLKPIFQRTLTSPVAYRNVGSIENQGKR